MSSTCVHCGNNPTNHGLAWFDQTLSILMTKVHRRVSRWAIMRAGVKIADYCSPALMDLLSAMRLLRWNDKKKNAPTERGRVLWKEAEARGYKIRSAKIFGKYIDLYEAKKGGKKFTYLSLPVQDTDRDAIWWMDDKMLVKKKLQAAGIPAPRGGYFSSFPSALAAFAKLDKPVIIKPRVGSRGRHTTTNIFTEEELKQAFTVGKKLCHYVIMEEHLVGSVYRGTVLDGEVIGILRGDPARITGDGTHTISELVEIKNKNKNPHVKDVSLGDQHAHFMARSGYAFDTILPKGKTIDLLEKIGISYGGHSAEVTPTTHPKIFTYLKRAANIIEYPIIGFDFIIEDIAKDPDTQKWGIIEANSAPFINLHHDPIEGTPINAAGKVWDYVEKTRRL